MTLETDSDRELNAEAEPMEVDEAGSPEAMWTAIEEGPDEEAERIALRKVSLENLYTPNIESLFKDLKEDSKVVHTVDPAEALENLPLWIPAIKAELGSLDGFNAIERSKGKEATLLHPQQRKWCPESWSSRSSPHLRRGRATRGR